jgi:hypothetical protein
MVSLADIGAQGKSALWRASRANLKSIEKDGQKE